MSDFTRLEIMPFARGEEEAAALAQAVRITVSCSPKHGLDHTVEVAKRLRTLGHAVTVHLAARMVRDRSHLDELLATLVKAGIDDTFLIGGDVLAPHGPYASALEVLSILHEHPHRPRMIGIAGYPEGHPQIDPRTLAAALKEKSRLANYIVTQLCFNPKAVLAWVRTIRQAGVALPVIVGLPGLVDRRTLLEISVKVGVGSSIAFLRKQGSLTNLLRLSVSSPERLYEALAPHIGDAQLGVAGFHYFTFNRLLDTWRWAQARSRCQTVDSDTQKEVIPR